MTDLRIPERDFQEAVIEYARLHGWLVFHANEAQRSEPGLPDLILARDGKKVLAELKTETGEVSKKRRITKSGRILPSQADWIEATGAYVWRPSDWPLIEEVLK